MNGERERVGKGREREGEMERKRGERKREREISRLMPGGMSDKPVYV